MKRVLLCLLFAGLGVAALTHLAGGLRGDALPEREAKLPRGKPRPGGLPTISPGGPIDIERASVITQMAPPTRITWKDRLSDETITIENFQPWRCLAEQVEPLLIPGGGGQGALLTRVVFEVYREPDSRAEALALRDGKGDQRYATLLHQRFEADEARVFGRLGQAMASKRSGNAAERALGDTRLELARNIVIHDHGQGIVIRGTEATRLTVYPERDHAKGSGPFLLTHEALTLRGSGLVMDRDQERGFGRIEIRQNPDLRITASGKRKDGRPLFDFGEGGFRPTTVTSEGSAVLERQASRRETVMTIRFRDHVHAAQQGGRTLDAGRATIVALRGSGPRLDTGGWKLRSFHAGKGVSIRYPGLTRKGETYLATVDARRLLYDVPEAGTEATTVFEERVRIEMRGEVAILGPNGRLVATCTDRASIGPLPSTASDGGLERSLLQLIALRGSARIERHVADESVRKDRLDADAIDLVVWPRKEGPSKASQQTRMTAIHFTAVGNVHLDSARVEGDTTRIVAEDLHLPRPHVRAGGEGTRFTFRRLARNQGLLGPDGKVDPRTSRGGARDPAPEKGSWTLNRVVARGSVDVATTLGGPSLGIPAHLEGDELTYDGLSQLARVRSFKGSGELVRLAWSATQNKTNQVETRDLSFDRVAGRVSAKGGVDGVFYLTRGKNQRSFAMGGTRDIGPNMDGAELTIRTDESVDMSVVRANDGEGFEPGAEQLIRIVGPVTTELRASSRTVDRMRSQSLEVALSFRLPDEQRPQDTSVPFTRASGGAGSAETTPGAPPASPGTVERIDVTAGTVRIDLANGEARHLEATGGVDLKGREGHVTGDRLTYDAERRRIEVFAGTTPARALLGLQKQSSEVQAHRMVVDMSDGRITRLEAHAPPGRTSDIHLHRDVKGKPGDVEWYELTYQDRIVMTDAQLVTQRVRVVRRVRKAGSAQFGEPAVLRTPRLVATGRQMLANDEAVRHIASIQAIELGTGPGSEVNFFYGTGKDRTEIWGHRFTIDLPTQRARFDGRPGRDLRIQRAGQVTTDQASVEFDLTTKLPTYISGSRVHWKAPKPGTGR